MPGQAQRPRRVIVTRPAHDAGDWVEQLQTSGFNAEAWPLMGIAAASSPADVLAVTRAWQAIDSYDACMFVSGNAVRFFFDQNTALPFTPWALFAINNVANKRHKPSLYNLRFMAPGPGTAAALRAAGVPAGQIDAPPLDAEQFDSEALWRVVGQRDWQGRRVLVVRGVTGQEGEARAAGGTDSGRTASSGRDWIMRQWQAAGAQVDAVGVYQRCPPVWTLAQVQRARMASADGSVWLFSSSEAVLHLAHLPGLKGADWSRAMAVATHPRITATARSAGWGVVAESRPALADILSCLRSIESTHP